MHEEIMAKVKAIILEESSEVTEAQLTENAHFTRDLRLDSLEQVQIALRLEDEFGIEVPEEDAEGIETVGQAVCYVAQKLAQRTTAASSPSEPPAQSEPA